MNICEVAVENSY